MTTKDVDQDGPDTERRQVNRLPPSVERSAMKSTPPTSQRVTPNLSFGTVTLTSKNRDGGGTVSPLRFKDQTSILYSIVAGLLAFLLVIAVLCTLWIWNRRKKQQVPYLRVTVLPMVSMTRSRHRAKNVYGLLPRRNERRGHHPPRNNRVFSTESLISGNSESRVPGHALPGLGRPLHLHRAWIHRGGGEISTYDNVPAPSDYENTLPIVVDDYDDVNSQTSAESTSLSSGDSRDYVNVPAAGDGAEIPAGASSSSPPNQPGSPEATSLSRQVGEGEGNPGDVEDYVNTWWSLRLKDPDQHEDGNGSSETSEDYVNVPDPAGEGDGQGRKLQDLGGSKDVAADPHLRTEEGSVTPDSDSMDYVNVPALEGSEDPETEAEEVHCEESEDYVNVPPGRDAEHVPDAKDLPVEQESDFPGQRTE
uniref:Lymphocyte transmembrane adaptor 1 n=1 Tax=Ornithorhynchus anatinus TaxID=9258 RepID=A0A6I8NKW9_ORNAN